MIKAICKIVFLPLIAIFVIHKNKTASFLSKRMHYKPGHLGNIDVHRWMDTVRGSGHRLKHGHSIENLSVILKKFGWRGVPSYFAHLTQDFFTPDGVPIIPRAWQTKQKLEQFGISPKVAGNLLSVCFAEFAVGLLVIVPIATVAKEFYMWNKYTRPAEATMREVGWL